MKVTIKPASNGYIICRGPQRSGGTGVVTYVVALSIESVVKQIRLILEEEISNG